MGHPLPILSWALCTSNAIQLRRQKPKELSIAVQIQLSFSLPLVAQVYFNFPSVTEKNKKSFLACVYNETSEELRLQS